MKKILAITTMLVFLAFTAYAQNASQANAPASGAQRQGPPIFTALDANGDGAISASEIANAAAALKKLDKNADGSLTPDEYKPPRPGGMGRPEAMGGSNMKNRPGATGMTGGSPRPENASGQDAKDQRPPKPPIDLALDADQNDVISASEIANAAAVLKKIDKNGDGSLSRDECRPARPSMAKSLQGQN
jgi:hypothetical protein